MLRVLCPHGNIEQYNVLLLWHDSIINMVRGFLAYCRSLEVDWSHCEAFAYQCFMSTGCQVVLRQVSKRMGNVKIGCKRLQEVCAWSASRLLSWCRAYYH